jgi:molecular chaperone GrpE
VSDPTARNHVPGPAPGVDPESGPPGAAAPGADRGGAPGVDDAGPHGDQPVGEDRPGAAVEPDVSAPEQDGAEAAPATAAAVSAEQAEPDAEQVEQAEEDAVPAEEDAVPAEEDAVPAEPAEEDPLFGVLRERDEYLAALQHLQADFENYKKRVTKQQTDAATRAAEALVDKLLPALDVADLALSHGGGDEVKQIWTALVEALEREGLERIDPTGGAFDPTRHDAVAHEPGEGGPQEVVEVLRAGYAWKGRVLRPAMVRVRG